MVKKIYPVLAFSLVLFAIAPNFAATAYMSKPAEVAAHSTESPAAMQATHAAKADWGKLSAKEKRAKRHHIKQALKDAKHSGADGETVLLVILAIILPPLAMALYDGLSARFWISLLLTILGYLPGLIYTLVIILGGR
jgi:uncharacterized membrane protein YqaE (UPF0057 family)